MEKVGYTRIPAHIDDIQSIPIHTVDKDFRL